MTSKWRDEAKEKASWWERGRRQEERKSEEGSNSRTIISISSRSSWMEDREVWVVEKAEERASFWEAFSAFQNRANTGAKRAFWNWSTSEMNSGWRKRRERTTKKVMRDTKWAHHVCPLLYDSNCGDAPTSESELGIVSRWRRRAFRTAGTLSTAMSVSSQEGDWKES